MENLILNKKIRRTIISILLMSGLIISGYSLLTGNRENTAANTGTDKEEIITLEAYRVMAKDISSIISLSGTTEPLDEVTVSPKISGKVVSIYAHEGDRVTASQILIQLERDQALLAAYHNAQASLSNTIAATNQDISMAELAVTTAQTNLSNTKINTAESVRNAELAIEAAEVALESAEKSLGNTKNTNEQTIRNAYDSITTIMHSNLTVNKTALTAIGDIIGEEPGEEDANDDYKDVLGVKDLQSLSNTKNLFWQAKDIYEMANNNYHGLTKAASYNEIDQAVNDVSASLNLIKQALNQTRILLDNTITKSGFSATSLNALKISVGTYLASIDAAISTLQAKEQAIINAKLVKTTSSDAVRAAYDAAKNNLERAEQSLVLAQSQAKTQIDASKKQLELAQAGLASAQSRAKLQIIAVQAQLDSIQARLGNTTIVAPISGILSQVLIDNGEMAMAGKPLASIVNTGSIKIELALTEFDIGQVSVSQEVKVSLAAYPKEEFVGRVYYVSFVADAMSKRFPVKIQLSNEDKKIKAGMVAQVNIITAKQSNILAIPKSAVFTEESVEKVYVVDENSKIKIKTVKIEPISGEEVIVKEGLTKGEKVVVNSNYELREGDEVNIMTN
jgi:RND family efflux transporter MFP subunit